MLGRVERLLRGMPVLVVDGEGVFCGNYSSRRGTWTPCKRVWCGPCYIPLDNGEFLIAKAINEDGVEMKESKDEFRFK